MIIWENKDENNSQLFRWAKMTATEATNVAIVVGAASGIGEACAINLARKGITVNLFDVDVLSLKKAQQKILDFGGIARIWKVDILDESQIECAVDEVFQEFGQIDILVNSVGVTGPTGIPAHNMSIEQFQTTFNLNFFAAIALQGHVVKYMLPKKYGRIVHIASISGKEGNPGMAPYSSSKAALIGFVKTTGKELALEGISVNAVAPAVIRTNINANTSPEVLSYMLGKIPMNRMGEPKEVADMVAFATSPECSFVTGFVFDLSGGRATY
jgi:3-oxoacyl-[acyl-carrier protein] reductase